MLKRSDGMTPRVLTFSPASIWRVLPFVAAGSACVLLACSIQRLLVEPQPDRLKLAACIWMPLAAVALALYLVPRSWLPDWCEKDGRSIPADRPWTAALLLTAASAMIGLVVIGLLMLYPPSIAILPLRRRSWWPWPRQANRFDMAGRSAM